MLAALKRHPFPVEAHFRYCLVLTYAFPAPMLLPLLPPGLALDEYDGLGFVAIALVQTEALRPAGWPRALGRSFFLSGYRIFTRFHGAGGKELRGLRILRSDTDSRVMAISGNLLTHYHYRFARVSARRDPATLAIQIHTPHAEADLEVRADLVHATDTPPPGSPFPDLATARHYAGPLPHTFDYEEKSRSMVVIRGVRQNWLPRPVSVQVGACTFFDRPAFREARPRLANAFFIEDIPYRWERGLRVALAAGAR